MKILELVEARRNADRYDSSRRYQALFNYIDSLSTDMYNRTLIHSSITPKIGIKPKGNIVGDNIEPSGIYTYSLKDYIRKIKDENTTHYGFGLPYVTAITLKPNIKICGQDEYKKIIDEIYKKYLDVYGSDSYETRPSMGSVNMYFRKLGYDVVTRLFENEIEYIILDSKAIESMKQFRVEHESQSSEPGRATEPYIDYGSTVWDLDQRLWKKYTPDIEFLKKLPEFYDIDDYSLPPGILPLIRLLAYAIKNKKVLSRDQEAALYAYRKGEYEQQALYNGYEKYVLNALGVQSKLSTDDRRRIYNLGRGNY